MSQTCSEVIPLKFRKEMNEHNMIPCVQHTRFIFAEFSVSECPKIRKTGS